MVRVKKEEERIDGRKGGEGREERKRGEREGSMVVRNVRV